MKEFLTVSELSLEGYHERGNIAAWVNYHPYTGCKYWNYKCSECGTDCAMSPTAYCANCGSLMINFKGSKEIYRKMCEEVIAEQEAQKNDIP